MTGDINLNNVYGPSDEIVAREIEGELIIVPLTAGVGDMEDELYTLNETGKEIWSRLDGEHDVKSIVDQLMMAYDEAQSVIEADVIGLLSELLSRKMIIEKGIGQDFGS
jgi:hypothetical protein